MDIFDCLDLIRREVEYAVSSLSQTHGPIPPIVHKDVCAHLRQALDVLNRFPSRTVVR